MQKYYEVQEFEDDEGLGEITYCCSPDSLEEAEHEYALCDPTKYRRLIEVDSEGMLINVVRADYGKED